MLTLHISLMSFLSSFFFAVWCTLIGSLCDTNYTDCPYSLHIFSLLETYIFFSAVSSRCCRYITHRLY